MQRPLKAGLCATTAAVAEVRGMLAEQTLGIKGNAVLMPYLAENGSQPGVISRSDVTPLVTLCHGCLLTNAWDAGPCVLPYPLHSLLRGHTRCVPLMDCKIART